MRRFQGFVAERVMLNVLRDSFKNSPYLKWVLIAVGVAMVLSLGSYFVGNGGAPASSAWVARVNGEEIPEWRFREVARNMDGYYRELFGANYEQLKPQLQIRRQALEALIEKELILQDAQRMGLGASPAALATEIRNHPSLQDANGQFIGKERYVKVLEGNYPGGFAAFERVLAEDLIQTQWTTLVTQPVTVSDTELEELFRKRTEKTAIDYVLFASTDQQIDREVDEAELRRWYDEHIDEYRRDEGQNIRYVVIDRDSQMDKIDIGPSAIQTHYETNQATYTHPEQRRARHILLRVAPDASDEDKQAVQQQAAQALERLQSGEDFATLAGELSEDPISAARGGDLDFFARGQMLEPFEQAVFDTPVGELAPLTETPHGFHVIEVTDSRPAGVTSLSEVEEDIRRLLRFRSIDSRLEEEANRLRDEAATADGLAGAAEGAGLSVESVFFNRSERIPGLGPSPEFQSVVAELEPGTLSDPLRVAAGVALVVVDEVVPEAPAPLEEVRSGVSTAILDERTRKAALAAARASNDRHADLAALARSLELEVQSSADLAPGQAPTGTGGSSAEIEEVLFGNAATEGLRGVVAVPAGAMVYEITRREPVDPLRFQTESAGLREETLQSRRDQYRQSVVTQLRSTQQIEYNPQWLDALDEAS
jgi:peptidyl-prolyl cis-trans isomerase D